jgi:6-carboxyhexanoate--CoA ligase
MRNLWSIRMRASKTVKSKTSKVKSRNLKRKTQNLKMTEIHISGAEGLYDSGDIKKVVNKYIDRAVNHPKGTTDSIVITIENIKKKPEAITSLPVITLPCQTPAEAKKAVTKLLTALGISEKAIHAAMDQIKKEDMRGASVITARNATRIEPDRQRGIRVSRLGVDPTASKVLSAMLSDQGLNTDTVKEALILASKVISSQQVIAELCVSDDPDYTTGYVASKQFGYVRIPNIKNRGSRKGGRAFFTSERIHLRECVDYLEKTPVMVRKISPCKGNSPLDEIVNHPYK